MEASSIVFPPTLFFKRLSLVGTVPGSWKELPQETTWSFIQPPLSSIFSHLEQGKHYIVSSSEYFASAQFILKKSPKV